jgi:MHS family proline/betaine transporter-like MFS transporter
MAGNVLEWYDFAVYGFFAATIGKHFFPSDDPSVSVVAAFGVFAVGFVARPVGAVVLGQLGDVIGRRRVMMASILLMAVPTFLIGVMPTYDTLGVMAPVILVLLRLLQGASVGGEFTSSVTFMIERTPPGGRRTLAQSWCFSGSGVGVLMGTAMGSVVTAFLTADQMSAWGWRLPFLAGASIAVFGWLLRRDLSESPAPVRHGAGFGDLPLVKVLRQHRGDFLRAIGITAFDASFFYVLFVYITTYLTTVEGRPESLVFDIDTASMVLLVVLVPIAALLGDRFGAQRMCLASAAAAVVLTIPLFSLFEHPEPWVSLAAQFGFVLLLAPYAATFGARMALLFPREVRLSAFSVSYNIGFAVFGGASPMIASYLIARGAGDLSPAYLLTATAAISTIALHSARRSPA